MTAEESLENMKKQLDLLQNAKVSIYILQTIVKMMLEREISRESAFRDLLQRNHS